MSESSFRRDLGLRLPHGDAVARTASTAVRRGAGGV